MEENSVTILPVKNPQVLQVHWPFFMKGIEKCLKFAREEDGDTERLFNEIWGGILTMWVLFIDNKPKGFMCTKPLENHSLLVYTCYSSVKLDEGIWLKGIEILNEYAKKVGMKRLEFYTIRDRGFEKKLKDTGWNAKYVLFSKEVS